MNSKSVKDRYLSKMVAVFFIATTFIVFTACGGKSGKMSFETVEEASKNLNGTVWADKTVHNKIEFANGSMIAYEATADSQWKLVWMYEYELVQYHYVDNQKPFVHIQSKKRDKYTGLTEAKFNMGCSSDGYWAITSPLATDPSRSIYLWQTSTRDVNVGDKSILLINQKQ